MKCRAASYEGDQPYVFLSYSHADEAIVFPIVEKLTELGLRIWFDHGLHAGDEWPEVIADHLDKSSVLLFMLSRSSADSLNCRRELSIAQEWKKPLATIKMEDFYLSKGLQLQLSINQFLSFYDFPSVDAFCQTFIQEPVFANCIEEEIALLPMDNRYPVEKPLPVVAIPVSPNQSTRAAEAAYRMNQPLQSTAPMMTNGVDTVQPTDMTLVQPIQPMPKIPIETIPLARQDQPIPKRSNTKKQHREKKSSDKKKIAKPLSWVIYVAIVAVGFLAGTLISKEIRRSNQYKQGIDQINQGNYIQAYESLAEIVDYKDSRERLDAIYEDYESALIQKAKVGDTICLGKYEQDGNADNGAEAIEWTILAIEDHQALIISNYVLDYREYVESGRGTVVSWEDSLLRQWLNEYFYHRAFSSTEELRIGDTANASDADKVFLLTPLQVEKYFTSNVAAKCLPAPYLLDSYAYIGSSGCMEWWAKSTTKYQSIDTNGNLKESKSESYKVMKGVRPAMWINLEETGSVTDPYDLSKLNVGDHFFFGTYEQDNILINGKEAIDWVVLSIEGDRAFVMSTYALDYLQNSIPSSKTPGWKDCDIRYWLNDDFLYTAFDSVEEERILWTTVETADNPEYNTNASGTSLDKVFLMDIPEVEKYLSSDLRQCPYTKYARAQNDTNKLAVIGTGDWWLRAPGKGTTNYPKNETGYRAFVDEKGWIDYAGNSTGTRFVRPAMWIRITNE